VAKNPLSYLNHPINRRGIYNPLIDGFSLIELLMGISITAILVLYAVPQFNYFIQSRHLELRINQLIVSLKAAKAAALNNRANVIVCRSSYLLLSCQGAALKGSKDWSSGWLVFVDSNADRTYQSSEKLLKIIQFGPSICRVNWNRGDALIYHRYGMQRGSRAGRFDIRCNDLSSKLVINWVGRLRRQDD
jgi:type IV fimbrial biogenesis protein FimT